MISYFEDFSLDTERLELRRSAELVAVEPQIFAILRFLIENRDRVVSKEDLIESVWNGRAISDSNLSSRMALLRQVLDDSGEEQRLIRTIPKRGFRFVGELIQSPPPSDDLSNSFSANVRSKSESHLIQSEKPSIAVLPFANLSGDSDQEYFADGVTEDVITALSQFRSFFVIARGSSFAYKARKIDLKEIGRELGVRYLLEGSVRRSGQKVRISGDLVDPASGIQLWADRFEGSIDDIFALQDRVTQSVVGAIAPRLDEAEINRTKDKPTHNLSAYDHYLRGLANVHKWTKQGNSLALESLYKAIEIDPNFAIAYGMAARCYSQRRFSGWMIDRAHEMKEAGRLGRRAAELGRDNPLALCTAGIGLANAASEIEMGSALIDRAIELNPNLAWAWQFGGWVNVLQGRHDSAVIKLDQALRLSPQDPHVFNMNAVAGSAYFFLENYEKAILLLEKSLFDQPDYPFANVVLPAARALAGDAEGGLRAAARLAEIDPSFRISLLLDYYPLCRRDDLKRWSDGLRKVGIAE